jgi:hypothetical protein
MKYASRYSKDSYLRATKQPLTMMRMENGCQHKMIASVPGQFNFERMLLRTEKERNEGQAEIMDVQKLLQKLVKDGFTIEEFSPYHFRINGRFDVYPNRRSSVFAWRDIKNGTRGNMKIEDFPKFIPEYLAKNAEADSKPKEKVYVPPRERGWWKCPIEGCTFKMRDDFSSADARRMLQHLEGTH